MRRGSWRLDLDFHTPTVSAAEERTDDNEDDLMEEESQEPIPVRDDSYDDSIEDARDKADSDSDGR